MKKQDLIDIGMALYKLTPLTHSQWTLFHAIVPEVSGSYIQDWADVIADDLGLERLHGGSARGTLDTMIACVRGRI